MKLAIGNDGISLAIKDNGILIGNNESDVSCCCSPPPPPPPTGCACDEIAGWEVRGFTSEYEPSRYYFGGTVTLLDEIPDSPVPGWITKKYRLNNVPSAWPDRGPENVCVAILCNSYDIVVNAPVAISCVESNNYPGTTNKCFQENWWGYSTFEYPSNYYCENSKVYFDLEYATTGYDFGPPNMRDTFYGTYDNEWSNMRNWFKAGDYSSFPIPDIGPNVTVLGTVTNNALGSTNLTYLNVGDNGEVGIKITVSQSATIAGGNILGEGYPNKDCPDQQGHIIAKGVSLSGDAKNYGILTGSEFGVGLSNSSINYGLIENSEYVTLNDISENIGTINNTNISVTLNDSSINMGMINNTTSEVTFNNYALNSVKGLIDTAQSTFFNNNSANYGEVTNSSNVLFFGGDNEVSGKVTGNFGVVNFNQDYFGVGWDSVGVNKGSVGTPGNYAPAYVWFFSQAGYSPSYNEGTINSVNLTQFNGISYNTGSITCSATEFWNDARNASGGSIDNSCASLNSAFFDNAVNEQGASITGNIGFFINQAKNEGLIIGTSSFDNDAQNTITGDGGTYGNFGGNAINYGTVDEALFGGDSKNAGNVTGTATFTFSSCNVSGVGTAGTFVPDPPPSCP